MNPILILDYPVVSYGVRMFVSDFFPASDIFHAATIEDAKNLLSENEIGLVIMDIVASVRHDMKIVNALRSIKPEIQILIFTEASNIAYATIYVDLGVNAFLSKESTPEEYQNVVDKMSVRS